MLNQLQIKQNRFYFKIPVGVKSQEDKIQIQWHMAE